MTSIRYFSDGAADEIDTALAQLDAQLEVLRRGLARQVAARGFEGDAPPPPSFEADARVARRTTRGPIDGTYIAEQLEGQPELEWYRSSDQPIRGARQFELHNFLDGKRSVGEVRDALSAEFGPIDPQAVSRYVDLLVKTGLAEWR